MNSYIKSVFFAVVFALIAWEITCFAPQGSVTINKAGSSASFIQQETNQNGPILPPNPKTPISTSITHIQSPLNTQQSNPQAQVKPNSNQISTVKPSNSGGGRDYVNPNFGSQLNPPKTQQPNPQAQVKPTLNQVSSTTVKPSNPQNSGGGRDYVNPNFGSQSNPKTQQSNPQPQQGNPNLNQATSTVKPTNPQNRGGVRDYVAPRPPRPEFPGLPPKNPTPNFPALPAKPPGSPQPATTPISYANKVAGGVTTKSPLSSGPPSPSGSTTEKPDEGPSDTELRDFSEALLRRDINNAGKYVSVNLQGKTTSQSQNDEAPQKLLEVKPEAFQIPTISKLKLLHNNYILDTNENEHVTAQEKAEENDLLEAMLSTPIMQYTKNFLITKGKISKDPKDFKNLLKVLWFNMYSRGGGRIGSSGFEHIFLAELKKNEVSGLHNWVYFDQAELNKIVDYLGYMKKIDLGEKGAILKFHFKLNGVDKPVDSMFIGTSPELEVALYTTCYLFRADRICPLKLNGNNFIVRTYNFRYRGKNMIGSAFPEI